VETGSSGPQRLDEWQRTTMQTDGIHISQAQAYPVCRPWLPRLPPDTDFASISDEFVTLRWMESPGG